MKTTKFPAQNLKTETSDDETDHAGVSGVCQIGGYQSETTSSGSETPMLCRSEGLSVLGRWGKVSFPGEMLKNHTSYAETKPHRRVQRSNNRGCTNFIFCSCVGTTWTRGLSWTKGSHNGCKHVKAPQKAYFRVLTLVTFTLPKNCTIPGCTKGKVYVNVNLSKVFMNENLSKNLCFFRVHENFPNKVGVLSSLS